MRFWMALPILMVTLAGCLGGGNGGTDELVDHGPGYVYPGFDSAGLPVPVLLCHDGVGCNFEMTPDEGRQGNEVTIAVNPTDPRNIVGGAKDYYPPDAGDCVWDGVYVTHDGGRTAYEDRSFDGSPWRALDGDLSDFEPNAASTYYCTTDPVSYFDVNGRLYYVLMAYQTDPVSGSKLCEGVCPAIPGVTRGGALNDWAYNRATQIVAISDDGGDTFHTFTPVVDGSYPVAFHDKAWLAASADGTIHIMWLASLAPGNMYCRSTDEGQSYQCGVPLATTTSVPGVTPSSGQGSFLEVGTGPEVYAMWTRNGGLVTMRRSMDTGATFEPAQTVLDVNDATMPGLTVGGFSRDERGGFPALATDRNPASPFADSLHVVFQDQCKELEWSSGCASDGSSVWVVSSHDKGLTWGKPVPVSGPGDAWEWNIFPTIGVNPGGVLDASWMSTRGTANTTEDENGEYPKLTQYAAYSLDGGATWSDPVEVRDVDDGGWDPFKCRHQNGMVFIGDYNDIDSSWQAAHPVWPDSRNGVCDVYTATVQRPMFADGWEPAARAEAEDWIVQHPL